MGTSFTTRTTIPTWIYLAASILIGGVLGIALTRTRRLELAGTLHAGIDKASLCLQTLTKYLIWSLPTLALLCAGILYLATANNPDPPTPAFLTGAKTLLTAWTTALATTILTTTTINENQLFTYFKNS
ncbi:hypothetical protein [Changpingibacter yushuensis]|uniref:hypothetical protein n=1 Tax=Changpingibacter yushuensis TaxID=2758440 RepID=UPI0015F393F4|nr:hypothetical protein [Changpingibacter yushuensis]